jgi:hypothetical protein
VVALPVRRGQVKLVPVHVKDGAGELRVAGELAAEGVRGAAVEHVAAVLVSVDRHVAQRGRAAQVQAPGQATHLFKKGLNFFPFFSLFFYLHVEYTVDDGF